MSKTNKSIPYSIINESNVEDLLIDLFQPSKNKLKKNFDKAFLAKSLRAHGELQLPLNFVNDGQINPVYIGPEIEIIYEDELFLVLNKPFNLFVHPLTYDESDNCLSFLRANNYKCLNVNVKNYDRGLLYRLDYETSGVLVYVKNEEAYQYFRSNFNSLAKEKIYYAKVSGHVKTTGPVETYIIGSEASGSKMKVVSSGTPNSLHAQLIILDVNYDSSKDQSVVKIKLLTGHRHQIRIQLSGLGYPIVGDVLYGGISADRLYLHAFRYDLSYQNKDYSFESPTSNF